MNIIETFKANKINFFSLSEAIDDSTPTGTAMLQMMGTFAELERNQIVENLTMGMHQRAREGKWNGGVILGYKSVSKQLIIEPDEAHIVKKIFEQYLAGKGYKAIAHQLNREGYKTKRKKAFSINSIRQILLNPVYAGFIRFGKTSTNETNIIKGIHEPIISKDLWDKVQELHKQKSRKPAKTFIGHFPLTTLLRCPTCNQGMIGHHSKKSKNSDEYIRYYQCGDFHYKGSAVCKSNLVRADDAEKYVFEKLQNLLSNTDYLVSIIHSLNEKLHLVKQPLHEQLDYINKQIASLKKNIEKYLSIFENHLMDGSIVKEKILKYEAELKQLITTRSEVEFEINKPTVNEITFDKVYHSLKHFQNVLMYTEPEKIKNLLHTIVKEITVNKGNSPKERSIKDIVLYFDTSQKNSDHVITYDTVHP